ncbi:MAG: S8 family peptidase [Methanofollis sp.]|uniref:S8 family peptidase n=1 Tax=Methanofollis sp. TaxID=2052835 RepID=UPI002614030E|nr:S8 family peptidase [Methanofollis sp.]MDD4254836.1 S8 family peptidase [Methanofollis sp.]
MSEHLPLSYYETEFTLVNKRHSFDRPKRDDKKGFAEVQICNLNKMQEEHQRKKTEYSNYLDPNLIFRIKLNSKVSEKEFIQFLKRCDIQYISPSPTKNGGISYRISLSETGDFQKIIEKINLYGRESRYGDTFDLIESFEPIPPEDKVGESLVERPLESDEKAYLDLELWRMESKRLTDAINGIKKLIEAKGGELTDKIITNSLCLIRVRIDIETLNEILSLPEVSRADRPPHPVYFRQEELRIPLSEIDTGYPPDPNDPAIIVLDSGISSGHPLLENGIGDAIGVPPERGTVDDVGHGTKVAGVALYGDIKKCRDEKNFHPEVWVLSAKVMYAAKDEETGEVYSTYDDRSLLENQLSYAIRSLISRHHNVRVVNISFGNEASCMYKGKQQPPLAAFIDELAHELDLIFVVSAGNNITLDYPDRYPHYLCEDTEDNKIIEPASSVYAITVGSITQDYVSQVLESRLVPHTGYPSPFTRTGPGLNGMIKPEIVEIGGTYPYTAPSSYMMEIAQTGVFVLNPKWIEERSLLTTDCGTSFSSPKVANYLARLHKKYPQYTVNTIKAFLLASARIPDDRPEPLNIALFGSGSPASELELINNTYGYGQPDFAYATDSNSNSVLLFSENRIKIKGIHYYYFYLPESFLKTDGEREISVTLVYNPPVRRTRMDYLGTKMEFTLYKDTDLQEIEPRSLEEVLAESEEEEDRGKIPKIELFPKKTARSKGIHQKGTRIYTRLPKIDASKPLVLEVLCRGTWIDDEDFTQNYSVVVTLRHSAQINLYNQMRERVMPRVRIR